jgi:transposase
MGVDFSIGAISQAHGKVAAALKAPVAEATACLSQAAVLHLDETSYPREGSTSGNWVWVAAQPMTAVFSVLPSRARYVLTSLIGESTTPGGVIVSDRYSAYAHLAPESRQVCWAHLIRDFTRISQRQGPAGRVGRRLLGLAYVMFRWRDQGRSADDFEPLQRRVMQALQRGIEQGHCSRTAKTCANVLKVWPALWSFLANPQIPPTNNAAEQALRSVVCAFH